MSAILDLTAYFEGYRATGTDQGMARCPGPNHANGDRHPSLSIGRRDDRWLLYCYALCDTSDILATVNLSLSDLYDKPLDHHRAPVRSRLRASDALVAVHQEVLLVGIVGLKMIENNTISGEDFDRLSTAVSRINSARILCCLPRVRP